MSDSFHCRSCGGSNGKMILDLGNQPLANNLLRSENLGQPEPRFPLRLSICHSCWLLQILDTVPPVELFSEYLYFSSFSETLLAHAKASAIKHIGEFELTPKSFVVEVASNDGYLLQNFSKAGIPCLGVEPAANIAKVAVEKGIATLVDFFGEKTARSIVSSHGKADLILGNNVFAHAPLVNDFVSGLKGLLGNDGRVVLEFPYGVDLIEHTEFDTIYHEHVFYFTLTALIPLFARHGLAVFHVERLTIHGGSLRVFTCHESAYPIRASVRKLLREEEDRGIKSSSYYEGFTAQVLSIKNDLCALLKNLKSDGKSIAAYGASAKGSTLLNFFGLGRETLDFVADRSTYKQGRFTPGTHIPIAGSEELVLRQPDYTLLLTWNFAEEILRQQQAYRDRGGKFIVPIPIVREV